MGNIDWTPASTKIHNLIRGLSPKPGAYSFLEGKKIIILRSKLSNVKQSEAKPGTVAQADPNRGIIVVCGEGALEILELKPESGRKITGAEYVRGHKCAVGQKFERKFGK
jgi:methionyl-tRNA formyltransferase